jgi:glycosyltransferase involved in cell wall biosynthesis
VADRVLFLDHAAELGGAERSLLELVAGLDRARWEPHVGGVPGRMLAAATAMGVPTHHLPLTRLRGRPGAPIAWAVGTRAVAGLARRLDATLVHANTVRAACYAAPAARLAGRPLIWHVRDFTLAEAPVSPSWLDRAGRWLLCHAAQGVIANSHAVAATLPRGREVTVVHNGIDLARFDPALDGTPFRRQHGIPVGAPLVGVVARLRPWKGLERFLRVAAGVRRHAPSTFFAVVGGDPFGVDDGYPGRLRRLGQELGLAGCLVFAGHVPDPRPALASLDVLVHPGDPEPFGLAVVEAMAMARPVVGFAHGALPEVVVPGQTGLLVPPTDEDAMAAAIRTLLERPAARRAMGEAGQRRAGDRFDARRMVAGVMAVMERVGAAPSPSGPARRGGNAPVRP